MQPGPSAGKRVRARHDWFWFGLLLIEKVARALSIDHRALQSNTKANVQLLSTLN